MTEAIFQSGGRQYKVSEGSTIEVDYQDDLDAGATLEFSEVLYVGGEGSESRVGTPLIDGAKVVGTVVGKTKGPKLIIAQFRRRKNSRRRVGHRQPFTRVKIDKIEG